MRVARRILKTLLVLCAVPVGVVLWYTPLSTGYVDLEADELARFTDALAAHGRLPVDFVVGAFDDRGIVIVGEAHRVAQDALFIQELIPAVYRRAGVRHLLMEFGLQSDQEAVDRLLGAPTFDRAAAKGIFVNFGLLWLYEEYLGVLEAAWRLNAGLGPEEPRFRILLGTPPRDRRGDKDAAMAEVAHELFIRGDKVLVYCGSHHGFTRYRAPLPFEGLYLPRDRAGRMGNRLWTALGRHVAFLRLHAPCAKRWALFAWPIYRRPMLLPFGGVIDRAYAAHRRPVGFWTSLAPFAALADDVSYYSLHRDGLTLSDFADGYIVLAPLAERRAVQPFNDLGADGEIDRIRERYAGTPYARFCQSVDGLRQAVASEGLLPEKAWAKTDRAGYDRPLWLPNVRLFWVAVAGLSLLWIAVRWRRRGRSHAARAA